MRVAYVDCFSGLSGDMFLGCLVDAGLELEALEAAVRSLRLDGYGLSAEPVTRQGISGHAVRVRLDDPTTQSPRHLAEVERIIQQSPLESEVKDQACAVFRTLADAEALVHGTSVDDVHFHEVGAVDAIVDIVGVVWGLRALGVERVFASSVPTGSGTVKTAHGLLPVPAPATMALLARAKAPLRPSTATSELVTPTGAALLTALATFDQPPMTLSRVSYGFGQKVFDWPNVARLWLGDTPALSKRPVDDDTNDTIVVIETNLDDETPEIVGATLDLLLGAGALDVFFTPIQMKRNRPAVKLTVLAPLNLADALASLVIRETSTLGVRTHHARRLKAVRWQGTVATPWGEVRVKVKEFESERRAAPEYVDCLAIAREKGIPLPEVYRAASAAAARLWLTERAI
jgi:uncharacterized protein (TIGR00299 family) protein